MSEDIIPHLTSGPSGILSLVDKSVESVDYLEAARSLLLPLQLRQKAERRTPMSLKRKLGLLSILL